jgi:uncharacterized membrane protein YbaN (DUF454 family)
MYRPGVDDADDPLIAEALAQSRRDPDLARWLEQQQAVDAALGRKFKQIAVPAGLKQQILSERKVVRPAIWWERRTLLAAAAAAVILAVVAGYLMRRPEPQTFEAYRTHMAKLVSGEYKMMLETNDLNAVRQFLMANHSPADYALPSEMQKLPAEGCTLINWHGQHVSLVCLDRGADNDLFLFIVNRSALPDSPPGQSPQFARVGRMTTASWTLGGNAYVLACLGSEDDLRKFL